jgi:hypothetical protein
MEGCAVDLDLELAGARVDHAEVREGRRARRSFVALLAGVAAVAVLASGCIFDGTWSPTPVAVLPVQGVPTQLDDVSCVSEDWCMAVGGFGSLPLVEIWDGTRWRVVTAPPLAPQDNAQLESVDCGSPTACIAKVNRVPDGPDDFEYLVAWDGTRWHEVPPGGTTDGAYFDPAPYSCAPDGTCLVVRQTNDVTVEWDGVQFTTTPYATSAPPGQYDVNAVECVSANLCFAAQWNGIASWNGSAWSSGLSGSEIPVSFWDGPYELACPSSADCVAVGPRFPSGLVAAHWDGAGWTEVALPAGWTNASDLTCAGAGACLLLGQRGATPATAGWNGSAWYEAPAPPAGTRGISCLPYWCLADAGNDSSGRPQPATYTWTDA